MARLRTAALLSITTALWCWLLTALHSIWSFGIVLDYMDGGKIPLYPMWPVTYGSFFAYSLGAFAITFVIALVVCSVTPKQTHLPALMIIWLIGGYWGASDVAAIYQIDFDATWGPARAFRSLFFHPLVTPFAIALGLAGTASLTRTLRKPA